MSDDLSSVLEVKPPLIARIPVVLDSPHSGTVYPADFQPQVSMEVVRPVEDSFVDELFPGPEHGAPMLLTGFISIRIAQWMTSQLSTSMVNTQYEPISED